MSGGESHTWNCNGRNDTYAEKAAIKQYSMHVKMINDDYVNAVLLRIIKDEEYHIEILRALLEEI